MRWIGVSQVGRTLMQLAGTAVLARMLMPADYGLMAMALSLVVFAGLFRDMGTGAAIVQAENVSPQLVNSVFWFNLLLGAGLALITAMGAPLAAKFLRAPALVPVLWLMSVVFMVESVAITMRSLLERHSRFRILALVELAGAAFGLAAAIVLAWRGIGVYALVFQVLIAAVFSTAMLWLLSDWRPKRPELAGLRGIAGFSTNVFAFNVLNYLHRNFDSFLIGRHLGSGSLGPYSLAYRTLLFPLQSLTFVVNRAILPAYSRHGANEDLAGHYLVTIRGIAMLTAPLMAVIWSVREPFVEVLFGPRWALSAEIIAWLAPVGFLQSIISTSGSVLLATGKSRWLRNLGMIGVPAILIAFVVGMRWGVTGVATAYCIVNVIWIFPVLKVTSVAIGGSISRLHMAWMLPALLAAVSAALVRSATQAWGFDAIHWVQFGVGGFAVLALYAALIWIAFRRHVIELLSVVNKHSTFNPLPTRSADDL